ncbi:hypothetical protein Tco_0908225 [Tanacetum coccineum]|uniref:Uncharacterized protein n=1 Tax=Tanacetum coccineum TaxID=301880 RepID=A0ABQ5CLR4_9ASTR
MRGVESTTSYVSKNIDIGGEAVEGGFWSKRQCVRQMDVHPHRDVDFTLDENTSMDNMNDSEIQPQLKRQCVRQSNRLEPLGTTSTSMDNTNVSKVRDYCFVSMDDARCVSNADVSLSESTAKRPDFILDTVFKPLALPASETIPTETNPMKITPAYSGKQIIPIEAKPMQTTTTDPISPTLPTIIIDEVECVPTNPEKLQEKPSTPPTEQQSTSSAKEEDLEKKLPKTLAHRALFEKVTEKLLNERELAIFQWPWDPKVLLKNMREKLNALGKMGTDVTIRLESPVFRSFICTLSRCVKEYNYNYTTTTLHFGKRSLLHGHQLIHHLQYTSTVGKVFSISHFQPFDLGTSHLNFHPP